MDERFELMQDWLESLSEIKRGNFSQPNPASSDASFRRYFRIKSDDTSLIIMDAPPENESCDAFIAVSKQLSSIGLNVPEVLAQDLTLGFLLLTDLGTQTYLSVLNEDNAEELYSNALQSLVILQTKGKDFSNQLPNYTSELLSQEMVLFDDWLGQKHLDLGMNKLENIAWQQLQNTLINSANSQPQVYVHRDYHSRNLMFTEPDNQQSNPGILDFQDALKGPLTYDAVSMLKDCYITWEQRQVTEWAREYFLMLCKVNLLSKHEWAGFQKAFDLMGVQRHLKASGIFARLYHRDGKLNYLDDIPATLDYLVSSATKYSEASFLIDWVDKMQVRL